MRDRTYIDRPAHPGPTRADTVRVATDDRTVVDIAREVVAATGWVRTG